MNDNVLSIVLYFRLFSKVIVSLEEIRSCLLRLRTTTHFLGQDILRSTPIEI